MNIYLVERKVKSNRYDTFSGFVVIAESPKKAKRTYPRNCDFAQDVWIEKVGWCYMCPRTNTYVESDSDSWVDDIKELKVTLIGEAKAGSTPGVILADFHAG